MTNPLYPPDPEDTVVMPRIEAPMATWADLAAPLTPPYVPAADIFEREGKTLTGGYWRRGRHTRRHLRAREQY